MKKLLITIFILALSVSVQAAGPISFGGVTDGDKGDVNISGSGTVFTVESKSGGTAIQADMGITAKSDSTSTTSSTSVASSTAVKAAYDLAALKLNTADPAYTGKLTGAAPTELTISGGVLAAPTLNYHTIDTEADGATDTLDTIGAGSDGQDFYIEAANVARITTLTELGNIHIPLGTTMAMVTVEGVARIIHLKYSARTSKWNVVGAIGDQINNFGAMTLGGIVLGDSTPGVAGGYGYDSGKFSFYGANSEDLYIEPGNAANAAVIGSNTGVTDISLGAINLATTGTLQAGIKISSDADGMDAATMTAAGMYGTLFIATGAGTWILPSGAVGMSGCLMDSGAAHDLILDVTAGDTMRLKGTEQADGVGITNAAGATTGDMVCFVCVAANKWSTVGAGSGTWASQ